MARSQSVLSHLPGMILGKNMKRDGERIHVEKVNLYSTVISQGQNVLEEKTEIQKIKVFQTLAGINGNLISSESKN